MTKRKLDNRKVRAAVVNSLDIREYFHSSSVFRTKSGHDSCNNFVAIDLGNRIILLLF